MLMVPPVRRMLLKTPYRSHFPDKGEIRRLRVHGISYRPFESVGL